MKKIIAMLVALTMLVAFGTTFVLAAEPDSVQISVNVTGPQSVATGDRYVLEFRVSGITGNQIAWERFGDEDLGEEFTYSGRSIDSMAITLTGDKTVASIVSAATKSGGGFHKSGSRKMTTACGVSLEETGDRLFPAGEESGTFNTSNPLVTLNVIIDPTAAPITFVPTGTLQIANWNGTEVDSMDVYSNETNTNLTFNVPTIVLGSVAATGVTLNKASTTLTVGGATETLIATVAPNNATNKNVTWSSSNTEVATVGATTGVVTAVSAGNAVITATTADGGFTATCNVTVNAAGPLLPADILRKDNATPVRKFSAGATLPTLKKDESATLTEDYYATEFETEALDFANYTYAVVAYEEGSEEPHQFEAIGGDLAELLGNIKFFVVIQKQTNPTKPITDIRVKAISAK